MKDQEHIFIVKSETELPVAAARIMNNYPGHRVFAFYGDLGAGKTTFIKAFCQVLDVSDEVASPSFSIINEYRTASEDLIYHFDFYRIKKAVEVLDIGFEEYIYSGAWCFMEWPEKIAELMPDNYVYIRISELHEGQARSIACGHIEE